MFLFNYLESCLFSPGLQENRHNCSGDRSYWIYGPVGLRGEEGLEKLRSKGPKVSEKADGGPSCI